MKSFEMPKNRDCKCREGRTYNKESKVCQECVRAGKTLKALFNKVEKDGNPDVIAMILFSMLVAKAEMEKEEKEEDE